MDVLRSNILVSLYVSKVERPRKGGGDTYFTLQHAESAFKNVHNGIINPLPMINHLIVMDTRNQKHGPIVPTRLLYALLLRFLGIPPPLFSTLLFRRRNEPQKLNVARGKEIPAAVDIHDSLTRFHALALDQLVELALFLLDGTESRGRGGGADGTRAVGSGGRGGRGDGVAGGSSA